MPETLSASDVYVIRPSSKNFDGIVQKILDPFVALPVDTHTYTSGTVSVDDTSTILGKLQKKKLILFFPSMSVPPRLNSDMHTDFLKALTKILRPENKTFVVFIQVGENSIYPNPPNKELPFLAYNFAFSKFQYNKNNETSRNKLHKLFEYRAGYEPPVMPSDNLSDSTTDEKPTLEQANIRSGHEMTDQPCIPIVFCLLLS